MKSPELTEPGGFRPRNLQTSLEKLANNERGLR
jgi:hypothetical protein